MFIFLSTINEEETRSYIEYLYNEYKIVSHNVAKKILKTAHDAEDVVQQTYIKIADFLEKNHKDNIKNEKAFVITLTKNTAKNHQKVNNRNSHIPLEEVDEPMNVTFIEPDINVLRLDHITEYTKKLMQLNDDYAYIIMLKYSEELTVPEIGKLLDISEDNVRKRILRARNAYMKILKVGEQNER